MINSKYIIDFMLLLGVCTCINADETLLVNTIYGALKGKWMLSRGGIQFSAFLGIPYAAAPVGKLRFMPPESPAEWEGVRKADSEGNVCLQRTMNGQEDCLYLNVFSHMKKETQLPVMVYIHGGGFYGGSASLDLYGPEYLMDNNIVLVTVQYRLGVFGFLSTEDSVVPGNMGLKDQQKALQWVRDNIKEFGGDHSKVTIFGNSAGSVSVHLHMISSSSRHLFAKAISQSGTAFSAFSIIGKGTSKKITNKLSRSLNCSTNSSQGIVSCLQSKTSMQIQDEYSKLQDAGYNTRKVLFRPVVEEPSELAFLTENPFCAKTNKPWLVGVNANEGLFKIRVQDLNETISLIRNEFLQFGPSIMFFDDTCSKPTEVAELIYNFYFRNSSTEKEIITALEQILTDSWFVWPTMQAIQRHEGILYCYLFNHTGEHSMAEVRGAPRGMGVSHEDELQYLFSRKKIFPTILNSAGTKISKLLVDFWVSFAKYSDPNPSPTKQNSPQGQRDYTAVWVEANKNQPQFLNIETNQLIMKHNIFYERMQFWKQLPVRDKLSSC